MQIRNSKRALCILLACLMLVCLLPLDTLRAKAGSGIDSFIERCYDVALQRKPDKAGKKYWKEQIEGKKMVGAKVAYEFIFSDEYVARNKEEQEFIKDLYKMFLDREPDEDGYRYWLEKMHGGESRKDVFAGFANSEEFCNVCNGYGITAGYLGKDLENIEKTNNVNLFVERMYNVSLGRGGDYEGQTYWVKGLLEGSLTGSTCAAQFINSREYKSKGLSEEEYLETLYYAFMGRESDAVGKKYWLNLLSEGQKTRDQVLEGFASSDEFKGICQSYGIEVGEYIATDIAANSNTIVVYSYFDYAQDIMDCFLKDNPDFKYEIKVKYVDEATDGNYRPELNERLVNSNFAPDIYMADAGFLTDYTKGTMSNYALPYKSLGIDVEKEIKVADIANYSVEAGKNKDGNVIALGYDANAGMFIYRRSIAKAVWGNDDPEFVKEKIGGASGSLDKFYGAAEELKKKGYTILPGVDELWKTVNGSVDKDWDQNGKLYIDPKREEFLNIAKKMTDKGYTDGYESWTDEWFNCMTGDSKTFGYFDAAWLATYTISRNADADGAKPSSYGDWAMCEAPYGFVDGGTWIFASKYVPERGKTEAVKEIIEYITLDASENGFQYRYAKGNFDGYMNPVVSGVVMEKVENKVEFLGNQNVNGIANVANKMATGVTVTPNSHIDYLWKDIVHGYLKGTYSYKDALKEFKLLVKDNTDLIVE